MKSLIAFKKRLEDQLDRLAVETKEAQDSLDTVNSILLDKGFKRGDIKEVPESSSMPKEVVLPKAEHEPPTVFGQRNSSSPSSIPIDRESVIPRKNSRVQSMLQADVWFEPSLVLEILGAEITLSPIHMSAMDSIRKGSGLAIRFPRFTGKYRTDKAPEDATTASEIVEMYRAQLKKISESAQT